MLLTTLTLTNFTVYAGTQVLNLAPARDDHPIVLIKGQNGAGKTSLLTAIQLALFGKRIVQGFDEKGRYQDLLASLAHGGTSKETAVSLEFKIYTLGEADIYKVQRIWKLRTNTKIDETLVVWKNGEEDSSLLSTWDDFIDTIIPINIANLFFFDGEKISETANDKGIVSLLKTGIQALLGINTLNQLYADLGNIIKNSKLKNTKNKTISTVLDLEKEISNIEHNISFLQQDIKKEILIQKESNEKLNALNIQFEGTGAHFYQSRQDIENDYFSFVQKVDYLTSNIIGIAEGHLPLYLLKDDIKKVILQNEKEQQASNADYIATVLGDRDQKLLDLLESNYDSSHEIVKLFLEKDRKERFSYQKYDIYLKLTRDQQEKIQALYSNLPVEYNEAKVALKEYDTAMQLLESQKRLMEMIPEENSVKNIIIERENLKKTILRADETISAFERKVSQLTGSLQSRIQEKDRELKSLAMEKKGDNIQDRTSQFAQEARDKVELLTKRVLEHSREHLQSLILESMQILLRKQNLITALQIDPNEYNLCMAGHMQPEIILERLSAGERQLIVIAILWGLAKASGRPLPLIIDTPLGRLDSLHRENLLEYYFPNASHQTILLATDTEVTPSVQKKLNPFIGREYILEHDDCAGYTCAYEVNHD